MSMYYVYIYIYILFFYTSPFISMYYSCYAHLYEHLYEDLFKTMQPASARHPRRLHPWPHEFVQVFSYSVFVNGFGKGARQGVQTI